jgi:hypothetical protein
MFKPFPLIQKVFTKQANEVSDLTEIKEISIMTTTVHAVEYDITAPAST